MSPLRLTLLPYIKYFVADVIANDLVEDVKPHIFVWTVCNKCVGWCYCLWQMEWPLQGELSLWQMLLPRVLILLQFEFWGIKQNLIPDMRQMEFAYGFIDYSHTPFGVTKFAGLTFSSVLKKLTAVSKSLAQLPNNNSAIEKII